MEEEKRSSDMIEKLTIDEVAALESNICPDCGGKRFLEGPHGGINVNIMCSDCGAAFNIIPGRFGPFGKERIGRSKKLWKSFPAVLKKLERRRSWKRKKG